VFEPSWDNSQSFGGAVLLRQEKKNAKEQSLGVKVISMEHLVQETWWSPGILRGAEMLLF
jgi:hypothetical protein